MPKKLCTFFLLERLGGKREMRDGDRARESSRRLPGAGPCWPFPGLTSRAARALAMNSDRLPSLPFFDSARKALKCLDVSSNTWSRSSLIESRSARVVVLR